MASDEDEIRDGWLTAARSWSADVAQRVMAPWRQARVSPEPVWALSASGVWVEQLNTNVAPRILTTLRRAYQAVTGSAPPPSFDQSAYVTQYLQASVNRMSNTPDQVYRQISDELAQGVSEGESVDQLAARVQAVFVVTGNPFWENRATVVARTEVQAAVNAGSLAGAGQQQIDTGRQLVKVWLAVDQPGRTRPAHLKADGQEQLLTAPFIVDNEPLQFPGDPTGSAENVIQCFPGDTRVRLMSPATKLFRRWYEGPMVRVKTVGGVELSATPNHPLLTDSGWKAAHLVDVSDKLVSSFRGEGVGRRDPDIENRPATFDELSRAVYEARVPTRVVQRGVDFHGDGTHGDVDVVPLIGELGEIADRMLVESPSHQEFIGLPDALGFLPDGGVGEGRLDALRTDVAPEGALLSDGGVGGRGVGGSLFEGHGGHAEQHGLPASAYRYASFSEPSNNDGAADPQDVRECLDRSAFGVQLLEVVEVERYAFQGFVFNLETAGGWYIANDIASSNCRCSLTFREA